MELNKNQIEEINKKCPSEQGVFFQPYGIPVSVKELVVYGRYETGGMRGGSCWGSTARRYTEPMPKDRLKVLDLVLAELMPNISYLQFKQIDELIKDNSDTSHEYYGNSTDWKCEYIILSELIELLETFNQ